MSNAGKVGIIWSPGFGAGWSTWGEPESAVDQQLAKAIDDELPMERIEEIAERNWPGQYQGGLADAQVVWVEYGQAFRIDEYDGNESLIIDNDWQVAAPSDAIDGSILNGILVE